MPSDMKFEESSLTGYLVKHLEPLTEANPAILADYVVALLKNDKPTEELRKLCTDNLVEFLGLSSESFVSKLFQALEGGSIARNDEILDVIKQPEPSQSPVIADSVQPKNSSPKEENLSTSDEKTSDSEDKVVSDDDDDDRNHKHRRREARPDSFDDNVERVIRQPSRKRSKPCDNGQMTLGTNPLSNEIKKEYSPASMRDAASKFEKRRSGLTPLVRAPLESGLRTRMNQAIQADPGPRFDLSTAIGRPPILGRGRGRSSVPWNQNDSRFNPLDPIDFASHMDPQGPSIFMGTGLPNAATTQNTSWGAFGFIPGMPNGILDPLHPLNLQGTLQQAINPPLNLGIPRQCCRDFEERGFCLRGDMCPMEHGVNRIVIEDVQSLSQFNLPLSIPSSHTLGMQAGTGSLAQVTASTSLSSSSKAIPSKNSKSAMTNDALKLNRISSTSGGGEADVYDPDQPLWNNDCSETSEALLRLPSPNIDDKSLWSTDSSACQNFRLSDGMESGQPGRSIAANIGLQGTNSSVWGRIGSGYKSEIGNKINSNVSVGNETKEDQEEAAANTLVSNQGKCSVIEGTGQLLTDIKPPPRSRRDSGCNGGRAFQKATRTLFVNGIPPKSNSREALLSHFQKFGEVIDIYIPLNSEKAFVQFSKREYAEAALKSPDAVMGNRFIKLWWANRDRIPNEGPSRGHIRPVQSTAAVSTTVPSQLYVADRGKESMPSAAQKESSGPAAEILSPVMGKNLSNSPKVTPPVQKKSESLELLKEELRKKQELLAQKRDDFRRQLDKLEKQAICSKKGEAVSEQAVKRHKGDMTNEASKATIPKATTLSPMVACQEAEKILEKSSTEEILVSPSLKMNLTSLQQSPRNINQTSRLPPTLQNRFKLDNRPTSFRILPPLPADFANLATLKDHFSPFGDLSSVLLEEPEACAGDSGLGPSQKFSACVFFTTRHSAEKAYLTGKCWRGHNLKFVWLKVSPFSNTDCVIQGIRPSMNPKGSSSTEAKVEAASSSLDAGKSIFSVISEVATVRNGDSMDVEGANNAPICASEALEQASKSGPSISACEKSTIQSDAAIVEDNTDYGCAQ